MQGLQQTLLCFQATSVTSSICSQQCRQCGNEECHQVGQGRRQTYLPTSDLLVLPATTLAPAKAWPCAGKPLVTPPGRAGGGHSPAILVCGWQRAGGQCRAGGGHGYQCQVHGGGQGGRGGGQGGQRPGQVREWGEGRGKERAGGDLAHLERWVRGLPCHCFTLSWCISWCS